VLVLLVLLRLWLALLQQAGSCLLHLHSLQQPLERCCCRLLLYLHHVHLLLLLLLSH